MGILNRLRLILASLLVRTLPMSRCQGIKRATLRFAGIEVGEGASIWSSAKFYNQNITIGEKSFIGHDVHLIALPGTGRIKIGANCDIAPQVLIHTGSHEIGTENRRAGNGYVQGVEIGDGCWIGTRVTILAGTTIGKGTIVAAGALVARNLPENCLAGGVPAKVIREL